MSHLRPHRRTNVTKTRYFNVYDDKPALPLSYKISYGSRKEADLHSYRRLYIIRCTYKPESRP